MRWGPLDVSICSAGHTKRPRWHAPGPAWHAYLLGRARKTTMLACAGTHLSHMADLAADRAPILIAICHIWPTWPLTGLHSDRHLSHMAELTTDTAPILIATGRIWLKPRAATDWPRAAARAATSDRPAGITDNSQDTQYHRHLSHMAGLATDRAPILIAIGRIWPTWPFKPRVATDWPRAATD